MTLECLINQFIQVKKYAPLHASELLDFIQRCYIHGEVTVVEYRKLFYQLNARGAEKPEYYSDEITPLVQRG